VKILSPWVGGTLRVEPQSGLGMIICSTSAESDRNAVQLRRDDTHTALPGVCVLNCGALPLALALSRLKTRPEARRFDFESDFARAANTPISLRGCN
jgi:hypothetical protein